MNTIINRCQPACNIRAPSALPLSSRRAPRPARSSIRPVPRASTPVVCVTAERELTGTSSAVAEQPLETVAVTFTVFLQVGFGEHLSVVGSHELLGAWEADRAPRLEWSEGHLWTATLDMPVGSAFEYKFIHVMPDRGVAWESTSNRTLTLSAGANQAVSTQWNNPMAEFEAKAIAVQSVEGLELLETPFFSTAPVPPEAEAEAPAEEVPANIASPAAPEAAFTVPNAPPVPAAPAAPAVPAEAAASVLAPQPIETAAEVQVPAALAAVAAPVEIEPEVAPATPAAAAAPIKAEVAPATPAAAAAPIKAEVVPATPAAAAAPIKLEVVPAAPTAPAAATKADAVPAFTAASAFVRAKWTAALTKPAVAAPTPVTAAAPTKAVSAAPSSITTTVAAPTKSTAAPAPAAAAPTKPVAAPTPITAAAAPAAAPAKAAAAAPGPLAAAAPVEPAAKAAPAIVEEVETGRAGKKSAPRGPAGRVPPVGSRGKPRDTRSQGKGKQ